MNDCQTNGSNPSLACEVCGKHVALNSVPLSWPYAICSACKEFWKNCTANGKEAESNESNMPCSQQLSCLCHDCKIKKLKQIFGNRQNESCQETSPAGDLRIVDKVAELQDIITSRCSGIAARIPLTPSNFDLQTRESVLEKIMNANRDYVATKYKYTSQYFLNKGGVPNDEEKLWSLVGVCIEEIVQGAVPFVRYLAEDFMNAPVDLCILMESSYFLMYCVQSGLVARRDVVASFGLLFRKMLIKWPEVGQIMQWAQQVIQAIRIWNPQQVEFSLLMSLIFCNSLKIANDGAVSPATTAGFEKLKEVIMTTGRVYLCDMYEGNIGNLRWNQLLIILDAFVCNRRLEALKSLKQRTPELVRVMVKPVCNVVFEELKLYRVSGDITKELLTDCVLGYIR